MEKIGGRTPQTIQGMEGVPCTWPIRLAASSSLSSYMKQFLIGLHLRMVFELAGKSVWAFSEVLCEGCSREKRAPLASRALALQQSPEAVSF